jgi:hypothetical protein
VELLRSQRNSLFDWVVQAGLSPLSFEINESDNNRVRIAMKNSGHYFVFKFFPVLNDTTILEIQFSPGKSTQVASYSSTKWEGLDNIFLEWLSFVKRETESPDKWLEMYEASKRVGWSTNDEANTLFTFNEFMDINIRIEQVKVKVSQINIPPDQLGLLHSKLDYISEKAKTLGRIDWKNLVIGTIIGYLVQTALPPETAKSVWLIVQEVFKKVLLLTVN